MIRPPGPFRKSLPILMVLLFVGALGGSIAVHSRRDEATGGPYTVLAWNDLGMHCISPRFAEMAILPPFNNLWVQVIKKGESPQIVTSGITVSYRFPNNKTVAGKTDFWQYVLPLFGVNPPPGTGLTGNTLAGKMVFNPSPYPHYEVTGIPILPRNDDGTWNPYQTAVISVKNTAGMLLAQAQATVPVSDEMNCQKCHADGGVAAGGFTTGTVEGNILSLHDVMFSTNLMAHRPVLCASCHADNALGTPGAQGTENLSLAMHYRHGSLPAQSQPACYDCHPGAKTQCNRSALEGMGPVSPTDPNCQHCHGGLQAVAATIQAGRRPWLDEPKCTQCHQGNEIDTGAALYRHSVGHHGVACEACHNSPHAWYPSMRAADNWQPLTYQGSADMIKECNVCHTSTPDGPGPHGGAEPSTDGSTRSGA